MIRTVLCWTVGALLLAGCSSSPSIPEPESKAPMEIPAGTPARPVKFGRIVVEVQRGTDVGEEMGHLACYYTGHLKMLSSLFDVNSRELAIDFYHALKNAHIPASGDPSELYPSAGSAAELEVSGVVDHLWLNICHPNEDYNRVKGGASVQVRWQIYDPIAQKVLYKVATAGAYKDFNTGEGDANSFIAGAVDNAVDGLLADQGFHDVVMSDPRQVFAARPKLGVIRIAPPDPHSSLTQARAATVTIFVAEGSGSGVIISPDGYALTAAHVVGENRIVRVRLSTHRDVMADVVRSDVVRDVALIKLAEDHLPAIPVRTATEPEVGEPVFAIGSPLGEQNDNTVTQGIISTYRTDEGLKFIQSDVSVQHGNSGGPLLDESGFLIGLCDKGESAQLTPDAPSVGINFFTPIGETMERLNIRYREAPALPDAPPPPEPASGHMQ